MSQKTLDWDRPLQTKGGRPVRILAKDLDFPDYPIVAAVKGPVGEAVHLYNKLGYSHSRLKDETLINVPEKKYIGIFIGYVGKVCATEAADTTKEAENLIYSLPGRKPLKIVEVELP